NLSLGYLFRGFNRVFDRTTATYGRVVGRMLRLSVIVLIAYAGLLVLTGYGFTRVPTGFIPAQDKGYLVVNVLLPDSPSSERTREVMAKITAIAQATDGVGHVMLNAGQSFVLNSFSSNFGSGYIPLKPFDERHRAD